MSRDAPRRYLIAYDVADDRRRVRVSTKLLSYGDRVQYSVFVVDGRPARMVRLKAALHRLLDESADSAIMGRCQSCAIDSSRSSASVDRSPTSTSSSSDARCEHSDDSPTTLRHSRIRSGRFGGRVRVLSLPEPAGRAPYSTAAPSRGSLHAGAERGDPVTAPPRRCLH
jgi:CRISPR-associated protein Cas2